jgi:hypothetical protein
MTFPHRLVAATVAAASLFGFLGCRMPTVTIVRRDDGILHIKCTDKKLQRCLDAAEDACGQRRYVVLRAFDDHDYRGRTDAPLEVRDSEAFVRCGQQNAWGGDLGKLRSDPLGGSVAAAPAPSAPVPAHACTPGASQACVGRGGCAGGQACLADGSAFGPCDCGGAPASP